MPEIDAKHTHPDFPGASGKLDRKGKIAWQYGTGRNAYYLPGQPGDEEFAAAYARLAPPPPRPEAAMRKGLRPDPLSYPPRGMGREEAARYIGVSPTKFDTMIADRRMPKPKRIDGRVVWDRVMLDIAFTDLPDQDSRTPIQQALDEARGL